MNMHEMDKIEENKCKWIYTNKKETVWQWKVNSVRRFVTDVSNDNQF